MSRRIVTITLQVEVDEDDRIVAPGVLRHDDPEPPVTALEWRSHRFADVLLDALVDGYQREGSAPVRVASDWRITAADLDTTF